MKRPIGITILALLYLLGGVAILVMQVVLWNKIGEGLESIGMSSTIGTAAIIFLGVLDIGAAIGMLMGKQWGWWAGAFCLFYSVARNLNTLVSIPSIMEQHGGPDGGMERLYVKYAGRVIIHSLLALYFFKANVVEYFRVGQLVAWKRFTILLVATIGIMGLFLLLQLLGAAND
jgi:hypothetical protein